MRALVIDDSRTIRRIMCNIMRELQYEVAEAGNGREALDHLQLHGAVDVAFVDWNMPVMDGLTFVRSVRANPAFAAMPIIMVTTETAMDRVSQALTEGVNEYVMKPFDRVAIEEKLQMVGMGCN